MQAEQRKMPKELETAIDIFQTGLDFAGMVPVVGSVFDAMNAGIYFGRGDVVNGVLSTVSMLSVLDYGKAAMKLVGKIARGTKITLKAGKAVKAAKYVSRFAKFATKAADAAGTVKTAKNLMKIGDNAGALLKQFRYVDEVIDAGQQANKVDNIVENVVKQADDVGNVASDALKNSDVPSGKAPDVGGSKGGLDTKLLDELANSGVKYNPEDIVAITKTADGKLVWLENGTDAAGLNHIITEHADDFLNKGITQEQIPDYVMNALKNGEIVGYQGRGTGRPIYEFTYNGEIHKVAITVGNNGFVVGANPK